MVFRIVNDIFVQKDINVCGDTNIGGVGTQILANANFGQHHHWRHKHWLAQKKILLIIAFRRKQDLELNHFRNRKW